MNNDSTVWFMIWNNYILSEKGLATLLVAMAVSLKLLINRKVTKLCFKKMIVSIPGEITFLIVGFLLSSMMKKTDVLGVRVVMAMILIAIIVLIIQYALERYLDSRLSGKIKVNSWLSIVIMYAMSIWLYYTVVFGGQY